MPRFTRITSTSCRPLSKAWPTHACRGPSPATTGRRLKLHPSCAASRNRIWDALLPSDLRRSFAVDPHDQRALLPRSLGFRYPCHAPELTGGRSAAPTQLVATGKSLTASARGSWPPYRFMNRPPRSLCAPRVCGQPAPDGCSSPPQRSGLQRPSRRLGSVAPVGSSVVEAARHRRRAYELGGVCCSFDRIP